MPSHKRSATVADVYDILIIGGGPGGYVAAIRAAQLGFKTAVVEREHLGGICLNWGCIPTKALLRSAEIFHYLNHAKDYGLKVDGKIGFDPAAVVKRSRAVSAQLNNGVGFLLKKNKVDVIWGEARIAKPGNAAAKSDPQGHFGRGHLSGREHHCRDRREAACHTGHRARRKTYLDVLRGHGARTISQIPYRDRFGRDRDRIRFFLSQHGHASGGR
jgi:hypothetical protein